MIKIKGKGWWIFQSIVIIFGLSINFKLIENTNNIEYLIERFKVTGLVSEIVIIIISIFSIILFHSMASVKVSTKIIYLVIASIYSSFIIVGLAVSNSGSIYLIFNSPLNIVLSLYFYLTILFVIYNFLYWIYSKFIVLSLKKEVLLSSPIKIWFLFFIGLCICWVPMFLLLYPGIWGWDGMDQINQFYSATSGEIKFYLTNHHPYTTTVIMGNLFNIGLKLFHNTNKAISLVIIFNNIYLISSFSYLLYIISRYCDKRYSKYLFFFFAFFPIFSFWANTVDKTCYFLGAISFFYAELVYFIKMDYKSWNKVHLFALFIAACLVGLTRNDGIFYVLFTLIGSVFLKNSINVKLVLTGALIGIFIFNRFGLPMLKVLPTEPMESMQVPMQQIALALKENPKSLSHENKKQLSKFLDVEAMSRVYTADNYDAVKSTIKFPQWRFKGEFDSREKQFNNVPIVKDKKELYSIWFNLLLKNKLLFFDSFLVGNYNYYFPTTNVSLIWNDPPLNGGASKYEYTKHIDGYTSSVNHFQFYLRNFFMRSIIVLPIFNLLFIPMLWNWLLIFVSTLLLMQNLKRYLIIVFPSIMIFIVMLMGPVNGALRYCFPLMIIIPILFIVGITNNSNGEKKYG
ncbi:DUF6020 family protein [Limosilactobacillus caviae]|uniref:DUF6020 family protein n=1 Tax=Limosilactobacillus caviae TaxID=1769424 RepID=UPI003515D4D4